MSKAKILHLFLLVSVTAHAGSESLALLLERDGHTERRVDPRLPSEAFALLDKPTLGHRNPARALVAQLLDKVRALAPSEQFVTLIRSSFPPELFPASRDLLLRFAEGDPAARDQLTDTLLVSIRRNPHFLNRFPTLPIEVLPKLQKALFEKANAGPGQEAVPFPIKVDASARSLEIKTADCTPYKVDAPVNPTQVLVEQRYLMNQAVAPCFFENSKALAPFLNLLTNALDGQLPAPGLSLSLASKKFQIRSAQEFFAALKEFGLTVELFDARVFVDFLGDHIYDPESKNWHAVRIATWLNLPLGSKRVHIPAEHGEVTLMIRQKDQRLAQVNWFFGIPDKRFAGTAAFWRPNIYLRPQWQAYKIENLEVLEGEDLKKGADWIVASAFVMKGFQAVHQKYDLPFNSYGIFVCVDSTAFALEKISQLRRLDPSARLSTMAFPIVYSRRVLGTDVDLGLIFAQGAEFNQSALFANVPNDGVLARSNPKEFLARLRQSFSPDDDDRRLKFFDEFKSRDLKIIREAP